MILLMKNQGVLQQGIEKAKNWFDWWLFNEQKERVFFVNFDWKNKKNQEYFSY